MAVQRGIDKWRMKKWFSVRAPKVFNDANVGEMPANDDKTAVGRNIVVSLDTLTHNPAHAYTNVTLKITGISGDVAQTKLVRMELLPSYIRSFVRRYRSVSSAVIPVRTKEGTEAVVKLIAITRSRSARTKIIGVRKEMTDFTVGYFRDSEIESAIKAIIDGKFQDELVAKLGHITDLNKVEVKKLEIG